MVPAKNVYRDRESLLEVVLYLIGMVVRKAAIELYGRRCAVRPCVRSLSVRQGDSKSATCNQSPPGLRGYVPQNRILHSQESGKQYLDMNLPSSLGIGFCSLPKPLTVSGTAAKLGHIAKQRHSKKVLKKESALRDRKRHVRQVKEDAIVKEFVVLLHFCPQQKKSRFPAGQRGKTT